MNTKRMFDLVVVTLAAIAWVPVLLAASAVVLLFSGRPVFYRSMRWVRTSGMVEVVKFRTMIKNADKLVNRGTVPVANVRFLNIPPDSPLYTRVGKLLERCGLTELPQLMHVLRGEMSIVGNRPLPDNVMECLRDEFSYADDRFLTPAGLTGPAQLVGRDALTDSERLHLEGAYCHAARSGYRLRLDFAILLYTVLIVLHFKKTLDYQGAIELLERHSKPSRIAHVDPAHVAEPARDLVTE